MENNPKDNKNIEKHKNVPKYVKMFKNKSYKTFNHSTARSNFGL